MVNITLGSEGVPWSSMLVLDNHPEQKTRATRSTYSLLNGKSWPLTHDSI